MPVIKRSALLSSIIGGAAFVIMLLPIISACTSSEPKRIEVPEGVFNNQTYMNLSRDNTKVEYCLIGGNEYLMNCKTHYTHPEKNVGFRVIVKQYKAIDPIINDLYIKMAYDPQDWNIVYDNSAAVRQKGQSNIDYIFWVSEDKVLSLYSDDHPIPKNAIEDYMSSYPPTHKFKPEEMDLKKQMKKYLNGRYDVLMALEKERLDTDSKEMLYRIIVSQCQVEMPLRCMMGMTNMERQSECPESVCTVHSYRKGRPTTDCPAALEMDDKERDEMWKEIKKGLNQKEVVINNVMKYHHEQGNCDKLFTMDEIAFQTLIKLEVDEWELRSIPQGIRPSMSPSMRKAYFREIEKRK